MVDWSRVSTERAMLYWPSLERTEDTELLCCGSNVKNSGTTETDCSSNTVTLATETNEKSELDLHDIIASDSFSDINRLLRVTSLVIRFILNIKRKFNDTEGGGGEREGEERKKEGKRGEKEGKKKGKDEGERKEGKKGKEEKEERGGKEEEKRKI